MNVSNVNKNDIFLFSMRGGSRDLRTPHHPLLPPPRLLLPPYLSLLRCQSCAGNPRFIYPCHWSISMYLYMSLLFLLLVFFSLPISICFVVKVVKVIHSGYIYVYVYILCPQLCFFLFHTFFPEFFQGYSRIFSSSRNNI